VLRPETRAQLGCRKVGNSLLVSSFLCTYLIARLVVLAAHSFFISPNPSPPSLSSPYPFHSGCPLFRSLFGNIVCVSRSGLETDLRMRDAKCAGTFFYNLHVCLVLHLEGSRLRLEEDGQPPPSSPTNWVSLTAYHTLATVPLRSGLSYLPT
jgi:hypothetical protein